MNGIAARPRVKVSADGHGVVSHAGVAMLRELADLTGLSSQVTAALADTYKGPWVHAPGDGFADLVAAVAGGADCVDGVGQLLGDREQVFGPVGSTTTLWRLIDERIDAAHLPGVRAARAHARAAAWAAGALGSSTCASTQPGAGPKPSPQPGCGSATRSDEPVTPVPTRRKTPPAPKDARPPDRHRSTCRTRLPESPSSAGQNRLCPASQHRAKN